MPFPFQEALSFSDHLLAGGLALLFVIAGACVCGGSVFTLLAGSRASESMDPRWDDLALLCAKTTRALAGWVTCPLGLGLWVVMMAQRPRMMEQLHSVFLVPALLGLLLFASGLCFSHQYIASWGRGLHENRFHLPWGVFSSIGYWCAAAVLVSACAFSMNTGEWIAKPTLWNAFWNPAFPVVFITGVAISISTFGAFGLLYAATRKDSAWRVALVEDLGKWMLAASVVGVFGWIWWGILMPEGANRNPVFWGIAAAVAATAALGAISYRWGVHEPGARHRLHAGAASALVVIMAAAFGWVYVETKGNFQIHRYMYRNGIIIEEAEGSHQTGLWNIVNLGEPMPAQEELGAFSFRAQCMACHQNWTNLRDPSRTPRFRYEGEALRFLGEMRLKHPPYPLLAGAPEERRALAAYLETLIVKSGGTLASRPEPPRAEPKPSVRPAVVSKPSSESAEDRTGASKVSEKEAGGESKVVPVLPPLHTEQAPDRGKEAGVPEKEGRPIGSPAPPPAAPSANKPGEAGSVSRVSSSPPSNGQDAKSASGAKMPPEEERAAASTTPLNDAQNITPEYGESVSAEPSAPPNDSQDAKKPEEKNSP
ncbi:MAG: hypothetical protein OXL41_09995 [Nitrospinae bacterium]|nr:hypothetical protein [Nitrospinota bacterium]